MAITLLLSARAVDVGGYAGRERALHHVQEVLVQRQDTQNSLTDQRLRQEWQQHFAVIVVVVVITGPAASTGTSSVGAEASRNPRIGSCQWQPRSSLHCRSEGPAEGVRKEDVSIRNTRQASFDGLCISCE